MLERETPLEIVLSSCDITLLTPSSHAIQNSFSSRNLESVIMSNSMRINVYKIFYKENDKLDLVHQTSKLHKFMYSISQN